MIYTRFIRLLLGEDKMDKIVPPTCKHVCNVDFSLYNRLGQD